MGAFANQMEQVTNAVPLPLGVAALGALIKVIEETNGSNQPGNS
jgi:hypothetical protein